MSEHLHLRFGEAEFEAKPENTTLFTFLGKTALRGLEMDNSRFNHIFFQTGTEDETTISGSYMFRTEENSETFDTIMNFVAGHDYPMVLNRRSVPECDVEAYFRMLDQRAAAEEIPDTLPEGWEL